MKISAMNKPARPRRVRLLLAAVLAMLTVSLGIFVTATPASAAGTCTAAAMTGKFRPGILLLAPRTTSLDFTVVSAACAMSNSDITSKRVTGQGRGEMACLEGTMRGTATVVWGTLSGAELRSTMEWTMAHVFNEWHFTGTVKSGEFDGETWTMIVPAGGENPAACLAEGGSENYAATASSVFA